MPSTLWPVYERLYISCRLGRVGRDELVRPHIRDRFTSTRIMPWSRRPARMKSVEKEHASRRHVGRRHVATVLIDQPANDTNASTNTIAPMISHWYCVRLVMLIAYIGQKFRWAPLRPLHNGRNDQQSAVGPERISLEPASTTSGKMGGFATSAILGASR